MMANVKHIREDVTRMLDRWTLIGDCLSGQDAIKAAKDRYLPRPNAEDRTPENQARYLNYLNRAVFYNVTARTFSGLVGQVFSREPTVTLPPLFDPLKEDIDGSGVSLEQQAKKALGLALAYGRGGLLADYPATEGSASRQEIIDGIMRPTVLLYEPENIINWRTITVGAKKMLSLVVIAENYVASDDGFEIKTGKQWRVLELAGGELIYKISIWRENDGEDGGQVHEVEQYWPKDAAGKSLHEIPFTFFGAVNNDHYIDMPPLYDLAVLNVAHYRNSADYEESCYMVGQPTPYFSGLDTDWVQSVLKGTVQLGSRAAVPLPVGASAGLLQASPNSMVKEAMDDKVKQMVSLGAKLVEQQYIQRTATEVRQEEASETSILASCAKNVAEAYRFILGWCGRFLGEEGEIEFELNTKFSTSSLSSSDLAQLIAAWQGGAITFEELRYNLRRADIAYLKDEEAKDQMEGEDNRGGFLETEVHRLRQELSAARAGGQGAANG